MTTYIMIWSIWNIYYIHFEYKSRIYAEIDMTPGVSPHIFLLKATPAKFQ